MAISQDIPQSSIIEFSLKITYVNFHLNLLGDNELRAYKQKWKYSLNSELLSEIFDTDTI